MVKGKANPESFCSCSHNSEGEYILWLAGFIEKITEGGHKPPPPIKKFIPEYMSLKYELDFL
ncbi:hypothetical protein ECE26_15750, partial [Acinetobacter baumannii]|nr:hypothetical protein [Acinetobacter baumannii]